MFYAQIDTEHKYGWDLSDPTGPPTPPGRRYKSTWNDLKTIKARENRVLHHAEYMMQQEERTKLKGAVAPLAYRACDFADHMMCRKLPPRSPRLPVAISPTKAKREEVTKSKEKAIGGWLINRGKQGILGNANDDFDGAKLARIERLLEGTAEVGAVAHQNINKLVNQHGKLEGIVETMGKHVVRVECEFNAKHDKLREDHDQLRAKQENDMNDVMAELQKLKLGGKRANRRRV